MSTQTIFTPAGVIFPTPIECSMEDSIKIMSAPWMSWEYSCCAKIKFIWVSGKGPSSRIEPAREKGMLFFTHSYITPLFTTPASTALAMLPKRRTVLMTFK